MYPTSTMIAYRARIGSGAENSVMVLTTLGHVPPMPADVPSTVRQPLSGNHSNVPSMVLQQQQCAIDTVGSAPGRPQRHGDLPPGLGRPDHGVQVTPVGRDVGVGQPVLVLGDPLLPQPGRVLGL